MRDLKIAQKLKSAYSATKSDPSTYESTYEQKMTSTTTEQIVYEDRQETGKEIMRRMSIGNKSSVDLSKLKRSQTFSSSTLPRNYGAGGNKVRGSILQDYNQTGNGSMPNSNSSGYLNNNNNDPENNSDNNLLNDQSTSQFTMNENNLNQRLGNGEQGIINV